MVAQEASIDISYWVNVEGYTTAGITDAMYEASTQNPYVFAGGWGFTSIGGGAGLEPVYIYSAEVAEGRRVATQAAVEAALAKLGITDATTPQDAAKLIHDYIAHTATYDFVAYDEIQAGATSDSPRVQQSQEAYGILVAGTAVCNGYAHAFQALAQAAGLQSVVVTGTATGLTTGSHAWNRVLLDGDWLTIDVNWDDNDFEGSTDHEFFLIDNNDPVLGTRTADLYWMVDENLGEYGASA